MFVHPLTISNGPYNIVLLSMLIVVALASVAVPDGKMRRMDLTVRIRFSSCYGSCEYSDPNFTQAFLEKAVKTYIEKQWPQGFPDSQIAPPNFLNIRRIYSDNDCREVLVDCWDKVTHDTILNCKEILKNAHNSKEKQFVVEISHADWWSLEPRSYNKWSFRIDNLPIEWSGMYDTRGLRKVLRGHLKRLGILQSPGMRDQGEAQHYSRVRIDRNRRAAWIDLSSERERSRAMRIITQISQNSHFTIPEYLNMNLDDLASNTMLENVTVITEEAHKEMHLKKLDVRNKWDSEHRFAELEEDGLDDILPDPESDPEHLPEGIGEEVFFYDPQVEPEAPEKRKLVCTPGMHDEEWRRSG